MRVYLKNSILKLAISLFVAFVSLNTSNANHIVGGELEMTNVGLNTYQITLNLYLDQFGSTTPSFVNTLSYNVSIYAKLNYQFKQNVEVFRVNQSNVAYGSPFCSIGGIGTIKLVYQASVTLNPQQYSDSNGYYLLWYAFCRNLAITNLIMPGSTGQVFYTEFPPIRNSLGQPFINSTPSNLPILGNYACLGQPFSFNYASTDPDGDSLVYSVTTPGKSIYGSTPPYSFVNWAPGIGVNNMVPGPVPFQITSAGLITFTPGSLGLFLYGTKVEEYRNGKKIGEMIRDFQIFVLPCTGGFNSPKVYAIEENGVDLTRTDTIVLSTNDLCVRLKGIDIDTTSKLLINVEGLNFSTSNIIPGVITASTNTFSANDTAELNFCLKSSCGTRPDSLYHIRLVILDNSCPFPRTDTIIFWVKAAIKPNNPPTLHHFNPVNGQIYSVNDTISLDQNRRCLSFYCVDVDTLTKLNLEVFALNFNLNLITQLQNTGFVNTTSSNDTIILSFCLPDCSPQSNILYNMRVLLNDQSCVPRLVDTLMLNVRVTNVGNNPPQLFAVNSLTGSAYAPQDTIPVDTITGCIKLAIVDYDTVTSLNLSLSPLNFLPNYLKPFQQQITTNYNGISDTAFIDVCFQTCVIQNQPLGIWNLQAQLSDISCPTPLLNNRILRLKPVNKINSTPQVKVFNPVTGQILQPFDTMVISPGNICIGVYGIDKDTLSRLILSPQPLNFPLSYLQGFINTAFVNTTSNNTDTASFSICINRNWSCNDTLLRLRLLVTDSGCGGIRDDNTTILLRVIDTINTKPRLVFFDNTDPLKPIVSNPDTLFTSGLTTNCLQFYVVDPDTLTNLNLLSQLISPSQPVLQSFSPLLQVNTLNPQDTAIGSACFVRCNPNLGTIAEIKIRVDDQSCKKNGLDSVVLKVNFRNAPDHSPGLQVLNPTNQLPILSGDTIKLTRSNPCFTISAFDPDTLTNLYLRILPPLPSVIPSISFPTFLPVNSINSQDTAYFPVCFSALNWPCVSRNLSLRAVVTDSGCHRNFSDTVLVRLQLIGEIGVTSDVSVSSSIDTSSQSSDTLRAGINERCFQINLFDPDTLTQLNVSLSPLNFPISYLSPLSGTVQLNNGSLGSFANRTVCLPYCTPIDTLFRMNLIVSDQRCPSLSADTLLFTFQSGNPLNTSPVAFMRDSLGSVLLTSEDTLQLEPYQRLVNVHLVDPDTLSRLTATFFPQNFSISEIQVLQSSANTNTFSANDTARLSFRLSNCISGSDSIFLVRMIYSDTGCLSVPDTAILHLKYKRLPEPAPLITGLAMDQQFSLRPGDSLELPITILGGDSSRVNFSLRTVPNGFLSVIDPELGPTSGVGFLSSTLKLAFNCEAAVQKEISLWLIAESSLCKLQRDSIRIQLMYYSGENPPIISTGTGLKQIGPKVFEFEALYDTINRVWIRFFSLDTMDWSLVTKGLKVPLEIESQGLTPGIFYISGNFNPTCKESPGSSPSIFVKAINRSCGREQDSLTINLIFKERPQVLSSIPNVITPNGDGFNDVFQINSPYWSCRFRSIKIVDRWGRTVYSTSDPEFKWEGNGAADGQYFYFIEFEENSVNGFIMLMR